MIVNPRKEMDSYLEELYTELDSVLEVLETGNTRSRTCYELDMEAKKLIGRFEYLQSAFYVYWYAIHYDIAITEDYLEEDDRFKIWHTGYRNFAYEGSEGIKLWSDARLAGDKHLRKDTHPNEYGIQVANETNYLFKYKIIHSIHNTLDWLSLLDNNRAIASKAVTGDSECKEQYFYDEIDDYSDIRRLAKEALQKKLLPDFIKEVAHGGKRTEEDITIFRWQMIRLRKLIYEEKPLSAWDIDTEGTLYYELFEQILKMEGFRTSDTNTEKLVTRLFNDASFLCTLTYDYFKRPYMHIGDFKEYVTPPLYNGMGLSQWERDRNTKSAHYSTLVMITTYFILFHSTGNRTTNEAKIRRTINELDSHLRDSSTYSYDAFQSFSEAITEFSPKLDIPAEAFHRRELTKELITSVDWKETTNGYNTEQITNIVKTIGRDDKERLWLIDAIENEVMQAKANDPEAALDELPF